MSNKREERYAKRTVTSPNATQGDAEGKPILYFRNPHLGFAQLSGAHWAHSAQQLHLRATQLHKSWLWVSSIHSSVALQTSEWQRMLQTFFIKLVPCHNTFLGTFLGTFLST